jgi:hypothetical protein
MCPLDDNYIMTADKSYWFHYQLFIAAGHKNFDIFALLSDMKKICISFLDIAYDINNVFMDDVYKSRRDIIMSGDISDLSALSKGEKQEFARLQARRVSIM